MRQTSDNPAVQYKPLEGLERKCSVTRSYETIVEEIRQIIGKAKSRFQTSTLRTVTNLSCQKSQKRNPYIQILTSEYSNLTRAIQTFMKNAMHILILFHDHSIIMSGVPAYVFTDTGPQFVRKFFASVCGYLEVIYLTTTTHQSLSNSPVEWCIRTIVTRLRHYVPRHQRNLNYPVQLLTYAYNTQVHRTTIT